jgi:hypothetical protein
MDLGMLFSIFLVTLFYTRVLGSLVLLSIALLALYLDFFFFLGVSGFPFIFFFSFSLILAPFSLGFLSLNSSLIRLFVLLYSLGVFSFLLGFSTSFIPSILVSLSRASFIISTILNHNYKSSRESFITISSLVLVLVR